MTAADPAQAPSYDVDALVDGQGFRAFNLSLLVWSFLAMFTDGFEISALGLAAPHIAREWGVAPGAMGPMMSASLIGILIGAPLFGYIGDRYGRRPAIILGCLSFGLTTLAVTLATSVAQITLLRLITGIGMGGLMPNAIALNSEMAPRRLRARLVILMFMGITLGGAVPGLVAAGLVPAHGWKMLFLVGGAVPLVVSVGLVLALPESVKYLALRPERRGALLRTLRRMRPDLALADDSRFAAPPAPAKASAPVRTIFTGGLAAITLLLWLSFATTLLANYFLNSWMPILFEAKGLSPESAALTTSMYHVGAVLGGLTMSFLLDRWGFLAVAAMLVLAAPAMLLVGTPGVSPGMLAFLVALAGFCVLGAQFGNNAAAGLIYPTPARSQGVGLAFAVGRVGSILGPMIGAVLIGWHLPLIALLGVMSATLVLGAAAALVLARLGRRRFGGWSLDESEAGTSS